HFKRVNDAHGHAAGDAVLTAAANMYVAHLRPYDLLYRYGGEEFLLCLPGADARTASMVLERLRGAIAAKPVEIGEGKTVAVTSSFGVTEMVSEASLEQTIGRADAALYASKNAGRNRVTVWAPDIAAPRPA
ncbi:MAG: diguanylate cyclase, partial [Alphaproteobacteria bacterium]|nr:diguanylate cyclase [Alphaproteobacteria bacterium]